MKLKFNLKGLLVKLFIGDEKKPGYKTFEFDWVSSAIIYLFFDGIIHESETVINELLQEIAAGAFDEIVISKLITLKPYGVYEVEISKDIPLLEDFIPYYLLQKKAGNFTTQRIDEARDWVKKHPKAGASQSHNNGYYIWSVWLKGETPPHEKPEWKRIIQETENIYCEAEKRRKDSIYGGRPKEILIAPRPELQEDFGWWSLKLYFLLTPKSRAPEFIDNKEYDEVAFEIGKRCLELMPNARERLKHKQNKYNDDGLYSFEKNHGLVSYVKLLINYGNLEDALIVCEECVKYGVHDGTKTGFGGRAEKITNKITKQNPKQKQVRAKGTLNDNQILQLVTKYMSSSSEDRQSLPAEYGITRTNLYYIVSKNKHRIEKSND